MYDKAATGNQQVFYPNSRTTGSDFTAGNPVTNDPEVPSRMTWSLFFGANPPLTVRYDVVGSAVCNATSGTANTAATSAQMSNANWTATGNNCWCNIESVTDQNGNSSTGKNIWVYMPLPSGLACLSGCPNYCVDELTAGVNSAFRKAMTGM